jgi:hypothetical protein
MKFTEMVIRRGFVATIVVVAVFCQTLYHFS